MVTSINSGLTPENNISNPFPQGLVEPVSRSSPISRPCWVQGRRKISPIIHIPIHNSSMPAFNSRQAAGQLLLPYPQYSGVSSASADLAASTYSSLQLKVQKRFAAGASINAAYTWSKLLSNTDTLTGWLEASGPPGVQNPRDLQAEKSLSANDAAQRLTVSYAYDLPFGRNRTYLASSSGLVNVVVGVGVSVGLLPS
jgi:hypothetical protein